MVWQCVFFLTQTSILSAGKNRFSSSSYLLLLFVPLGLGLAFFFFNHATSSSTVNRQDSFQKNGQSSI
jgi:hypothetical protein